MPEKCAVLGCKIEKKPGTSFYRIPGVPAKRLEMVDLAKERIEAWIKAIGRETGKGKTTHWKVCNRHFISGMCYEISEYFQHNTHIYR